MPLAVRLSEDDVVRGVPASSTWQLSSTAFNHRSIAHADVFLSAWVCGSRAILVAALSLEPGHGQGSLLTLSAPLTTSSAYRCFLFGKGMGCLCICYLSLVGLPFRVVIDFVSVIIPMSAPTQPQGGNADLKGMPHSALHAAPVVGWLRIG